MSEHEQPYLTLDEAAAELQVDRRFVEELVAAEILELVGSYEHVSKASVERYLQHWREAENRPLPFDDRVRVPCTSYCNRYCVSRCILSPAIDFDPRLHTIVRNMIRCLNCNAIVESEHGHDYRRCPCGAVAVDGGRRDLQRTGTEFEELSIIVEKERGRVTSFGEFMDDLRRKAEAEGPEALVEFEALDEAFKSSAERLRDQQERA